MLLTIDMSAKDRLVSLLNWLKKRSNDKTHENNADVIADFVEKIIVVELKRLDSKPETITQEIEVPDDVMAEPLLKMKDSMDTAFQTFMSGKGITVPQSGSTASPPQPVAPRLVLAVELPAVTPRNGNGHQTKKVRDLKDSDRKIIDEEFQAVNGEFKDATKSATNNIHPKLPTEIAIWQVTGRISHLHREIAAGRLEVTDMDSYKTFLEEHKKLWAQYNSPKYQKLRTQQTVNTTPTLSKKPFPVRSV